MSSKQRFKEFWHLYKKTFYGKKVSLCGPQYCYLKLTIAVSQFWSHSKRENDASTQQGEAEPSLRCSRQHTPADGDQMMLPIAVSDLKLETNCPAKR